VLLPNGGYATAASQNGFSTYKLSLTRKLKLFRKMTKEHCILITFIFCNRTRSSYDTFVELCKHYFVNGKSHRYVAPPLYLQKARATPRSTFLKNEKLQPKNVI
jgi:hypothetical protein